MYIGSEFRNSRRTKVLQIIFSGQSRQEMPGYIYLIMMADGVYKIGMTAQTIGPSIKRLGAYPGDSRTVYVRWCEGDVSDMERRLIWEFRRRFGKHQRGNEYFVGPEETMIDIITTFFTDPEHKKSVTCSLEQFLNSEFVNKGDDLCVPLNVFVSHYYLFCTERRLMRFEYGSAPFRRLINCQIIREPRHHRSGYYFATEFIVGVDINPFFDGRLFQHALREKGYDRPTLLKDIYNYMKYKATGISMLTMDKTKEYLQESGFTINHDTREAIPPP